MAAGDTSAGRLRETSVDTKNLNAGIQVSGVWGKMQVCVWTQERVTAKWYWLRYAHTILQAQSVDQSHLELGLKAVARTNILASLQRERRRAQVLAEV